MLPHFANRRDRIIDTLTIAQQHALLKPDRRALGGALGDRELLRAEIEALRKLRTDGKVSGQVVDKILKDNPSALYGL